VVGASYHLRCSAVFDSERALLKQLRAHLRRWEGWLRDGSHWLSGRGARNALLPRCFRVVCFHEQADFGVQQDMSLLSGEILITQHKFGYLAAVRLSMHGDWGSATN
jgi:hypothetical protein